MREKVLIIGAAGFIGLHLARKLLKFGFHVDIVDNFYRGVRDSAFEDINRHLHSKFFPIDCLSPEN